jgi:creatinine amidohydrolase
MTTLKWGDLSWTDFRDLPMDEALAVLPIGSMEQHGPHLPVETDGLCADLLVKGICDKLEDVTTVVMPRIWCSRSNEHIEFPGTVFLEHETFVRLVMDICASVARAGFKRMVILNWHGGNTALLASIVRDIRQEFGLLIFVVDGLNLLSTFKPSWFEEGSFDIHAEHLETSMLQARHPGLVKDIDFSDLGSDLKRGKMAKAFKGYKYLIPEGGPVLMGWMTHDLSEDGVIGKPHGAKPEDGEEALEYLINLGCEIMREIATFDYER